MKMKRIYFKYLSIIVLIALGFVGCSKDENNPSDTSTNVLKHNTIEYSTPNGMLVFQELINTNLCKYDLQIYSSNFTFNSSTGKVTGINGTGQIITFYIISPIELTDVNADEIINANDIVLDNLTLEAGEYSFSSDNISKTFEADFSTSANSSGYYVYSISSGTMSISRSGKIYEISYSGMDENGLSITGYFKGKLSVIRNQ
jgi:hypothetical protein